MIHERGGQYAETNGQRPAEFGREEKGEELGFVADFGEGDDAGGDEEGVQCVAPGRTVRCPRASPVIRRRDGQRSCQAGTACAMAARPSVLTQAPSFLRRAATPQCRGAFYAAGSVESIVASEALCSAGLAAYRVTREDMISRRPCVRAHGASCRARARARP